MELDPQVVNLAKAIRQTESGGNFNAKGASGEFGAYQWTPATWKGHAQEVLGDANAPMTKDNQQAVAYTVIKNWRDQGLNPAQIAAKWNSGSSTGWENKVGTNSMGVKYNVPQYVKNVTDYYQQFKGQSDQTTPTAPPQQNNQVALFPSNSSDNPLQAGLKAVGNTIPSALNFAKGAISSLNPLKTTETIGQIGSGFQELSQQKGGAAGAIFDIIKGLPEASYTSLVPFGVRALLSGDTETAAKAFTNDPFGQIAPVVLGLEGAAKLGDVYGGGLAEAAKRNADNFVKTGVNVMPTEGIYTQAFNKGIDTAAAAAKPVTAIAGAISKLPIIIGKSTLSHLTGLDPQTLTAVISDPTSFSKLQQDASSRPSVAADFKSALDQRISDLQDTGKGYDTIRQNKTTVTIPSQTVESVLAKYGINVVDGELKYTAESRALSPVDKSALQGFYDTYGNEKTLSANAFLNTREALSNLSKYDIGKTKIPQIISRDLRSTYDALGKDQLKGLRELDSTYAPEVILLKKARKDFLNPDGTFKDGAINKIANAKGVGKQSLINRMEQISPGIGKSIQILKAVEDIQRANGIKVGNYARALVEGHAFITGNIPVVIAAILSHPAIAVQLLRGFGYTGKAVIPIVHTLKLLAGDTPKGIPSPLDIGAIKQNSEISSTVSK